jgi:hypothetical protein
LDPQFSYPAFDRRSNRPKKEELVGTILRAGLNSSEPGQKPSGEPLRTTQKVEQQDQERGNDTTAAAASATGFPLSRIFQQYKAGAAAPKCHIADDTLYK